MSREATMATVVETVLRNQLQERRRRLVAVSQPKRTGQLESLLVEVDEALARLDSGSFGICDVCHEDVEAERLLADPLCRVCLDHLSSAQRVALERDLENARRLQVNLLPDPATRLPGWDFHALYEPLGAVSGDYYDLVPVPRGGAYVLFGDVSGKGLVASMVMAGLQGMFRSLATMGLPLGDLFSRGNRLFSESGFAGSYATLVGGRLSASGELEIANAGHCPPLLLRRGKVEELDAGGVPLGLFPSAESSSQTFHLDPGDLLLLYTDGISEAAGPDGEEYGRDRIARVLGTSAAEPGPAILKRLADELRAFQGDAPRTDDRTVVVLRRVESPP